MTPLLFLRQPEARHILERAAKAAGTPVAVHHIERGDEGPCITGAGQRMACRYVHGLPKGPKTCRDCRIEASRAALRDGMATPFLCHMGFACVAAPVFPDTALGFVVSFGPYCPAEAPENLAVDARRGLLALHGEEPEEMDSLLSDIRAVYSDAAPAIVEWAVENLNSLWELWRNESESESPDSREDTAPARRKVRNAPESDPFHAGAIVAALAGGDQREARAAILTVLAESPAGQRNLLAARRARAIAMTGAVIEAAERARLNITGCWERMPGFVASVGNARTNAELANAVTGVLRVIRRRAKRPANNEPLTALNKALLPHLGAPVTLNKIAAELGEPPSTITRRLQRMLGVSFCEYVGRQRVNRAKQLLRTTRLGIGEIARRVGIKDSSNFSKVFRKFEKCSPQQYRARFGRKS
ncbi:MAG TPA: helix-turn-helix domain-containing protein [Candidatus Hydrogenedentes bacterium]|nr:helix-turn-helix domain-containing protein [Candidatus Hydrogenedentota bacterium]